MHQRTKGPRETQALGERLGQLLVESSGGFVVSLDGPLGAGKTCFAKGVAAAFGVRKKVVTSPTYAYMNQYESVSHNLFHLDFYRVDQQSSLFDLCIMDALAGDGICIVEWGERFERALPSDRICVRIEVVAPKARDIVLTSSGRESKRLLQGMTKTVGE